MESGGETGRRGKTKLLGVPARWSGPVLSDFHMCQLIANSEQTVLQVEKLEVKYKERFGQGNMTRKR